MCGLFGRWEVVLLGGGTMRGPTGSRAWGGEGEEEGLDPSQKGDVAGSRQNLQGQVQGDDFVEYEGFDRSRPYAWSA